MRHIEAQRGEFRHPRSYSKLKQRTKASDQSLGTGISGDSGGNELADTLISCSKPLSTPHLIPGLQTQMTKWPTGVPQLIISHVPQTQSVPVNSLSSPPPHPADLSLTQFTLFRYRRHLLGCLCPVRSPPQLLPLLHPATYQVRILALQQLWNLAYFSLPLYALVQPPPSQLPSSPPPPSSHGLLSVPLASSFILANPISTQHEGNLYKTQVSPA